MKKVYVLLSALTLVFAALIFSSYSAGLANIGSLNQSGSAGTTGSCGGTNCHTANTPNLILSTKLMRNDDSLRQALSTYKPNTAYKFFIQGNSNSGLLTEYSYQLSITNAAGQSVGFIVANTNKQKIFVNGVDVLEPKTPLLGNGGFYNDSIVWISPAAGAGSVNFNLAMCASNNDGTVNGDICNAQIFTASEQTIGIGSVEKLQKLSLHPNPAKDVTMVSLHGLPNGNYQVMVIDALGKIVRSQDLKKQASTNLHPLQIQELPTGIYMVWVVGNQYKSAATLQKQ